MNFFSSEKLTGKETREDGRCKKCDAQLYLVRRILDPLSGKTIRMFERKCGSRTWSEKARRLCDRSSQLLLLPVGGFLY